MTDKCDLHVPYKAWADDPQEEQNYNELERWSYRLHDCLPAAPEGGSSGITAITRLQLWDGAVGLSHGGTPIALYRLGNSWSPLGTGFLLGNPSGYLVPLRPGFLLWTVRVNLFGFAAPFQVLQLRFHIDDIGMQQEDENRTPPGVSGVLTSSVGGGVYVPAGCHCSVIVYQYNTTNSATSAQVYCDFTLMEV